MKLAVWGILAGLVALVIGYFGYRMLLKPVIVEVPHGDMVADAKETSLSKKLTTGKLKERLLAAGLNANGQLGDIGVHNHMERLRSGEVNNATLLQYAQNLVSIGEKSAAAGARIPASFWDVETPALKASGWSAYRIAQELAAEQGMPYLNVLAKSYARFLRFRNRATETSDTAVDAALDILLIARDYVRSIPPERLLEHSPEIKTETHAILMAWQTMVAGSTRRNPITHKPVFSHGFIGRYNVSTMYQYDVGKPMSISETWGVTGFAPRFVGTPDNANQVEHLSISVILQAVLGKPVLVLNAIEEEKLLIEGASKAEAYADMALNTAVHDIVLPFLEDDLDKVVTALRVELKKP